MVDNELPYPKKYRPAKFVSAVIHVCFFEKFKKNFKICNFQFYFQTIPFVDGPIYFEVYKNKKIIYQSALITSDIVVRQRRKKKIKI